MSSEPGNYAALARLLRWRRYFLRRLVHRLRRRAARRLNPDAIAAVRKVDWSGFVAPPFDPEKPVSPETEVNAQDMRHAMHVARAANDLATDLTETTRRFLAIAHPDGTPKDGALVIRLDADENDGGWVASAPAFPGAVAQGETQEEAATALVAVVFDVLRRRRGEGA